VYTFGIRTEEEEEEALLPTRQQKMAHASQK
jgi:hypothetical protein